MKAEPCEGEHTREAQRRLLAEPGGVDAHIDMRRLRCTPRRRAHHGSALRRAPEDAEAAAETHRATTNDERFAVHVVARGQKLRVPKVSERASRPSRRRARGTLSSSRARRRGGCRVSRSDSSLNHEPSTSPRRTEEAPPAKRPLALKKRHRKYIARISWGGEAFTTVFASRVAADPSFAERHAAPRRAPPRWRRARRRSPRARGAGGASPYSPRQARHARRGADRSGGGQGASRAAREAVAETARREREKERARYAWILDLPSPLDALPHRLRCALARKMTDRVRRVLERERVKRGGRRRFRRRDHRRRVRALGPRGPRGRERRHRCHHRIRKPNVRAEARGVRGGGGGARGGFEHEPSPAPRRARALCAGVAGPLAGEPRRPTELRDEPSCAVLRDSAERVDRGSERG